jgi:hypothetical protein
MKHKARTSKGQKPSRPIESNLLKQVTELQKLRKQVRLAEAAVRPRHEASQVGQL